MNLNYFAFAIISLVPLMLSYFWYSENSLFKNIFKIELNSLPSLSLKYFLLYYFMGVTMVYGYMNLVIHQLGFYELFFTDIMLGNEESKQVVNEFLSKYGTKHRHFFHGVFHGGIIAFGFCLPMLVMLKILGEISMKRMFFHFTYLLVTSLIIGGLISAFI